MLQRFIESFTRAVTGEMECMRQRMGPYEIPVAAGEALEQDEGDRRFLYAFRVLQPSDKLVQGGECNLVTAAGDDLVSVVSIAGDRIVLASTRPVDLLQGRAMLVIYPWFLYERLLTALGSVRERDSFHTRTALALFGKLPAHRWTPSHDTQLPAAGLNDSQRQAVTLCRQVSPAFVWGPPGTGKTTTLGHIILSLLRLGQRVLVTSTTNAAVDQALARFAGLEDGVAAIDRMTPAAPACAKSSTAGTLRYAKGWTSWMRAAARCCNNGPPVPCCWPIGRPRRRTRNWVCLQPTPSPMSIHSD